MKNAIYKFSWLLGVAFEGVGLVRENDLGLNVNRA